MSGVGVRLVDVHYQILRYFLWLGSSDVCADYVSPFMRLLNDTVTLDYNISFCGLTHTSYVNKTQIHVLHINDQ